MTAPASSPFAEFDDLPTVREWAPLSRARLRAVLAGIVREGCAPRRRMTLTEWSDAERYLPSSSSSEPGQFRSSRLPYLRAIMDALTNPRVRKVVVAKGAQVGATTVGENWIGYTMAHDPAAVLSIWPTEKMLRKWSLTRLDPMIEQTQALRRLFERTGLRDSGDSIAHKDFPGGSLNLLTAKSTADLRSSSAPRLHLEEVDEFDVEIGDQGDPIEIARARARTFWDSKEYVVCTPTIAGRSRIWRELEDSCWNEWWMPCPHCKEMQVLRWRDGHANGDDDVSGDYRFLWEKDSLGAPIPGTTTYTCVANGCEVEERSKPWMLERGEWIARSPEHRTIGFHLPSMVSPLISWDIVASDFYRARKDPAKMRVVVNTHFGLPYRDQGESISAHWLQQRAVPYGATVPDGVRFVTVAGDMQGDSAHLAWVGWGAGEQAWVLRWRRIHLEDDITTWPQLMRVLGEHLLQPLLDRNGKEFYPVAGVMDGRFHTLHVQRFLANFRLRNGQRVIGIQGVDGRSRPILESSPIQTRRRSAARKPLRSAAVDIVKDLMATRLRIGEPGPQYINHPTDPTEVDPIWYDGVTAEELKSVYSEGRWKRMWRKKAADLMNEPWDLLCYNYIAFHSLGTRVQADLDALAREGAGATVAPAANTPVTPRARSRPRVVSQGVY